MKHWNHHEREDGGNDADGEKSAATPAASGAHVHVTPSLSAVV